jgi:hypothetical protein
MRHGWLLDRCHERTDGGVCSAAEEHDTVNMVWPVGNRFLGCTGADERQVPVISCEEAEKCGESRACCRPWFGIEDGDGELELSPRPV